MNNQERKTFLYEAIYTIDSHYKCRYCKRSSKYKSRPNSIFNDFLFILIFNHDDKCPCKEVSDGFLMFAD